MTLTYHKLDHLHANYVLWSPARRLLLDNEQVKCLHLKHSCVLALSVYAFQAPIFERDAGGV